MKRSKVSIKSHTEVKKGEREHGSLDLWGALAAFAFLKSDLKLLGVFSSWGVYPCIISGLMF